MFTNNIENAKRSIRTAMDFDYEVCKSLIKKNPDDTSRYIYQLRLKLEAQADMVLCLLEDPNKDEPYQYALEYRDSLIEKIKAR